ncbi:MAG: TetR/AcrR family transcriptional regulator [Hyphomonas sp.]
MTQEKSTGTSLESENASSQKRGRPRDPELNARVLDAAIELYAAGGWAVFTFDAISRTAKVGKSALYNRWPSREDLLSETLEQRWLSLDSINTGTFRGDIEALAWALFEIFSSPTANVILYLQADSLRYPEVRHARAPYMAGLIKEGRSIVKRGIKRNEISPASDTSLVMDILVGTISNHISTTPLRLRTRMMAKSDTFIGSLVDLVEASVCK